MDIPGRLVFLIMTWVNRLPAYLLIRLSAYPLVRLSAYPLIRFFNFSHDLKIRIENFYFICVVTCDILAQDL